VHTLHCVVALGLVRRNECLCFEAREPCMIMRLVSLDEDRNSVPIHVNIIMNINIILHRCTLTDSNGKEMGGLLHRKREKGGES
jgi:hypothetical protein